MKNKQEKKFIPVMLTPFKENGDLDLDGLSQLTELYIQAGVKGLFANCQSSEMFQLSDEEKLTVVKHVIKIAGGRVPVVAVGNFGATIEKQADFMQTIYDTGVQAVIIVTGLMAGEHELPEVFEERVFTLFELTGKIPIGFYECPEPYKRVLTAEQLQKFLASGRIIYHKDTCLDLAQVKRKLEVSAAYPEFELYDAYAVNAVDSLKAGAAGLSCIQGNFFPELLVWLCDHVNDTASSDNVYKVQRFLTGHMNVIHHVYPLVAKYFLQKCGLNISTFTRTATGKFTAGVKGEVDCLFDQYHLLKEEIGLQELTY